MTPHHVSGAESSRKALAEAGAASNSTAAAANPVDDEDAGACEWPEVRFVLRVAERGLGGVPAASRRLLWVCRGAANCLQRDLRFRCFPFCVEVRVPVAEGSHFVKTSVL